MLASEIPNVKTNNEHGLFLTKKGTSSWLKLPLNNRGEMEENRFPDGSKYFLQTPKVGVGQQLNINGVR